MERNWSKEKQGLYDPQFEHDACGIAMLANIKGITSHKIVTQALIALERMNHRGGRGSDRRAGDGAGIMTGLPHRLFQEEWQTRGVALPEPGQYGVAMLFLPAEQEAGQLSESIIEEVVAQQGLHLIGWRACPTDESALSAQAEQTRPGIRQLFVA